MKAPRRGFLGKLSLGMFGLVVAPRALYALTQGSERAREVDEPWLQNLVGRHKQFFDVAALNAGAPLTRAGNFLDVYRESYGFSDSDLSVVFGAHGSALALVLNDDVWSRYGFGSRYALEDPATKRPAARNIFSGGSTGSPFEPSVTTLQKRGVRFIACRRAIGRLSRELASATGASAEQVRDELLAGLLPGVLPVPAMIVAANRAQEGGLTYVYLG